MTELILFKASVIRNGFFNDSLQSWIPSGTGSWQFYRGYAQHNADGITDLTQYGVVHPTIKYTIKLKITGLAGGENLDISLGSGTTVSFTSDGSKLVEIVATEDLFQITASAGCGAKISNISVVEAPGSFMLDYYEDASLPTTHSIDDLRFPESRTTSYSKSIILPGTHNNHIAFGNIFELGIESTFNPNKESVIVVKQDGAETFRGTLCLNNIVEKNTGGNGFRAVDYNVSFIGALGSLFNKWGDLTLQNLDFSEFDHIYDGSHMVNSWAGYIKQNGSYVNNTTTTYTSPSISSIAPVTFNGDDRVEITFSGAHSFSIGDEVFGETSNNLLSGFQTVVDITSTSITLNLLWNALTDTANPSGTFSDFHFNGFGYIYPMIDMGTPNNESHQNNEVSGPPLIVGKNYIIKFIATGDSFGDVGAPVNFVGTQFKATGSTPANWANGSIVAPSSAENWRVSEFFPAIFIRGILQAAFKFAGYEFNAPIFDTRLFKRAILPFSNGEDFSISTTQQKQFTFRASMLDTVSQPSGHVIEYHYNLYPYSNNVPFNAAPTTFYPVSENYSATSPANTYVVASHHKIIQNDPNTGVVMAANVIPFNDDSTSPNNDAGNNYDETTLYVYEQSSGFQLTYSFSFSGTCWNYIKNPTAYDISLNPTGDLPDDFAGTGAPGIYSTAGNNGKLFGSATVPLPNSLPVYNERTDVEFKPYNAIAFQKSVNGGTTWTTVKVLSASGAGNGEYSSTFWNNTVVKGTCDITLEPFNLVRIVAYANAKVCALRSDGHPCVGASAGGSAGTGIGAGGTGGPVRMTIRIENAVFSNTLLSTGVIENMAFSIKSILPNIKISDFFLSIIQSHNCLVEPNKFDRKVMDIETRDDYYDNNAIDWTHKLDANKNLTQKPMAELNAKTYLYTYKADKDFYNDNYTTNWGGTLVRTYGDRRFEVDNDFVTNTNTTQLVFSPTPMVGSPVAYQDSDRVISAIYSLDTQGVVKRISTLRFLYLNIRGTDNAWNLSSSVQIPSDLDIRWGMVPTGFRFYPQAIHVDNHLTPNADLNFGTPFAYYYDAKVRTLNDLFNRFHKRFIEEITDRDSKNVEADLLITPVDMQILDFRHPIILRNHLLRLKKINEYDQTLKGTTLCEFIKIKRK